MMFGEKINLNNFNESSKAVEKSSTHSEPFSFSALHFLRNRLLPAGKLAIFASAFTKFHKIVFCLNKKDGSSFLQN